MLGDRWGVTDAETSARYPCDDLVPRPTLRAWRGVTIDASRTSVWRRLVQVRLAPYSYDWIDNGGHRSPRELLELPDPVPGDPFSATAGHPIGRVLDVEHEVHLTARIMGATMSYVLRPEGETTRLVLKIVAPGRRLAAQLLCLGDLPMARRQLLTLKSLAESA